jgi:4-hydroxybenzoyl-CoA thioesterase
VPPNETPEDFLPADTTATETVDGLLVHHAVTVEWGNCDAAGIIYYPTYFKWWDQGTWRLFWAIGLNRRIMRDEMGNMEMPILNAAGNFESPVTPGDRLVVESRVERWGNSSFRIAHRVLARDGKVVAHGHETRCWTTNDPAAPGRMKAQRIPDDIIARMGGKRAQ